MQVITAWRPSLAHTHTFSRTKVQIWVRFGLVCQSNQVPGKKWQTAKCKWNAGTSPHPNRNLHGFKVPLLMVIYFTWYDTHPDIQSGQYSGILSEFLTFLLATILAFYLAYLLTVVSGVHSNMFSGILFDIFSDIVFYIYSIHSAF